MSNADRVYVGFMDPEGARALARAATDDDDGHSCRSCRSEATMDSYTTHADQLVVTPEGATVTGPSRDRDGPFRPGRVTVEGACRVDLADDGQSMTITFEQEDDA